MTLNIVNKAPDVSPALRDCIALLSQGGAVLLLEDAVRAAAGVAEGSRELLELLQGKAGTCYVLQDDLLDRGLAGRLLPACKPVDYAAFVQLCLDYDKVLSWA